MKGIIITKEIKLQFDERIDYIKKRLEDLQKEFPRIKREQNQRDIFDWKIAKLCFRNEIAFRESVLEDAKIID